MRGFLLIGFLLPLLLAGQGFEPNRGQWEGDFHHRLRLTGGAVFLENNGFSTLVCGYEEESHHPHTHLPETTFAFRTRFVNGRSGQAVPGEPSGPPANYFLGNDPTRWKSGLRPASAVTQVQVWPGVDVRYTPHPEGLKYDLLLASPEAITAVRLTYEGVQPQLRGNRLTFQTPLGSATEHIPAAWQESNGTRTKVECSYRMFPDGTVGFELGPTRPGVPVVIDPVLVFASMTGSSSDNWGFTAAYDSQGRVYGGGIVFGPDYPVTTGVVQPGYQGGSIDCGITVFSPNGTSLLYSTYLGGTGPDQPHSLVVDSTGAVYVFGVTGSSTFPTTGTSYQPLYAGGPSTPGNGYTFSNGSDLFITKLSPDGSSLVSSTFLGGSGADGISVTIHPNYGDKFRGDILISPQGNVLIASTTRSLDFPVSPGAGQSSLAGPQDAVVASLSNDLTQLNWGSYLGGWDDDVGYGLAVIGNTVYLAGAVMQPPATFPSGGFQNSHGGGLDGFILSMDLATGNWLNGTYLGTPNSDLCYFISSDRFGNVYATGQTWGSMPVTPGKYCHPPGMSQGSGAFFWKLSGDLSSREWSTVISNYGTSPNLSPTAFLVDDCLNIYFSGWGGSSNTHDNTFDMPVTPDAIKDVTDGSDFYFLILGKHADELAYASYYGGTADEHVDGGTSRFSPEGIIYQAVCAACGVGSFPTTPGVVGPADSSNCNLGVIKIEFNIEVLADANVDFQVDVDTTCNDLQVTFTNNSINAEVFLWDFGNGDTSSQAEPTVVYTTLGTYEVTLIAMDTICGLADTTVLYIEHDRPETPVAAFQADYRSCDKNYEVTFTDASSKANSWAWDFGDGQTGSGENPVHYYPGTGTYQVQLVVMDTLCGVRDTATATITFTDTIQTPELSVVTSECSNGTVEFHWQHLAPWYQLHWYFGDGFQGSGTPNSHQYPSSGYYPLIVEITDTLCGSSFSVEQRIQVQGNQEALWVPNAFSPNGDGINENLIISGDQCWDPLTLSIFNRWGELLFYTDRPMEEFWNGMHNGEPAQQGVYTLVFRSGNRRWARTVVVIQ